MSQKLWWGFAPSFSAQVRFGEPRAPVPSLSCSVFRLGSTARKTPRGLNSLLNGFSFHYHLFRIAEFCI
jgi:hypothetical protein